MELMVTPGETQNQKPKKDESTPNSGFGFRASFGFLVSGFGFLKHSRHPRLNPARHIIPRIGHVPGDALAATVSGLARYTALLVLPIRPGKLRFVVLMH